MQQIADAKRGMRQARLKADIKAAAMQQAQLKAAAQAEHADLMCVRAQQAEQASPATELVLRWHRLHAHGADPCPTRTYRMITVCCRLCTVT